MKAVLLLVEEIVELLFLSSVDQVSFHLMKFLCTKFSDDLLGKM